MEDTPGEEIQQVEIEGEDEDNCGFVPFDKDAEEIENGNGEEDEVPAKRRANNYGSKEERAEAEAIMDKISRLLCRYPGLIPRTTMPAMERLEGMSIRELRNVYKNCISDVLLMRGSPSSEFVIVAVTHKIDQKYARGYTRRCLHDRELKRDVEEEIVNLLGILPNPIVIIFRFANNLYKTIYDIAEEEEDELFYPRGENNRTYGEEKEKDATQTQNNSEFIHPINEERIGGRGGGKRGRDDGPPSPSEERSQKRQRRSREDRVDYASEPEHPNYPRR